MALVMAVLAFILGSAAYTPALILAIVAPPLSISCLFLGVWRISVVAIYFAVAALVTAPLSRELPLRIDYLLVILGVAGLALALLLYLGYLRAKRTA